MPTSFRLSRNRLIYALAALVALIVLLMWLQGAFEDKVPPGLRSALIPKAPEAGRTVRVIQKNVDDIYAWPGSVAARIVARIAPKLTGRIIEISVESGDRVKRGQILARLDETEIRARLDQARSSLAAADAEAVRSRADARRLENLFYKEAATRQDLDSALAASRSANARRAETREVVREAASRLGETILKAPFDAIVVERLQEPGDTALPGSPILLLQQSQDIRIESAVPAHCARLIKIGDAVRIRLTSPEREVTAVVDEIQPVADPTTRTVLIKARLPSDSGTQPGAFGWLYQSCGRSPVLLVPAAAVSRIGQLESVRLVVDGAIRIRHVRTGKRYGDQTEILAGLKEGDKVELPEAHP